MPAAVGAAITWWGSTAFVVGGAAVSWGTVVLASYMVYGTLQARSAARKMAAANRDAYNAGLSDRTVSIVSADNPWQVIYGEATVGASFTAILTSGARDEFKHVVAVWAAHRCHSIEEVYLAGQSLGTLDANGYVTSGPWYRTQTAQEAEQRTAAADGVFTTTYAVGTVLNIVELVGNETGLVLGAGDVSVAGSTVTITDPGTRALWAGRTVQINYERTVNLQRVRVRHHLGTDDQTADAALLAEVPAQWAATDRGRGLCYSVFTFDLNEPEFQAGPPQPTARIKGALLYDPRLDGTQPGGTGAHRADTPSTWAWSANNALCVADFLRAEYGKRAASNQVLWPSVVAAANACDSTFVHEGAPVPLFTCNGTFRTNEAADVTLDQLCQSMAGFATFMGAWHVQAGVYTAPVMALTDADNAGAVEVVPSPAGDEVINGLRGRFYDPANYSQVTDYPPYINAAFVTEDGDEYVDDLTLPYTNAAFRCHNLARIQVERSRGMQLVYPAKMRALRLKPGQRITLSNSVLGISNEVFRVVKREFAAGQAVKLGLVHDDATYYDQADAPATLPPPTVPNGNPWVVAPVAGLTVVTGTAALLLDADGTVISRVRLQYTASADVLVRNGGALQAEVRKAGQTAWTRLPDAPGDSTSLAVTALQVDRLYLLRVRWRNAMGAVGDWRSVQVLTEGASAVTGTTGPAGPAGADGAPGASVYTGTVYLQTGSAPAAPTGGTFNFTSGVLTAPAGWTITQPATTTTPTYACEFTFITGTPGATVTAGTWTTPYIDAVAGTAGGAGESVLVLEVFLQAASAPATPSGGSYTFSTDAFSAPAGGWTRDMPASSTTPTWRAAYRFATSTPAVAVAGGTYSAPVAVARNGADGAAGAAGATGATGAAGAPGASVYTGTVYLQTGSAPAAPTGGTFNFTSGVLTAPAGWTITQPATTTTPTYACEFTFITSTPGATVTAGTWTTPYIDAVAGTAGGAGAAGESVLVLEVFLQAASAPATPSGGSYTFSTDAFTAPAGGWTRDMPASSTTPTWRAAYRFATSTPAVAVAGGTYSTPVAVARNGSDGAPGVAVVSRLSANAANFSADSTGLVDAGQSFPTTVSIQLNGADDTSNWSLSRTSSDASITTTLSGALLTVTGMGTAVDSGYVDVTATRSGYASQVMRINISKTKRSTPASAPVLFGVYSAHATVGGGTATAAILIKSDGTVQKKAGAGSYTTVANWYTPTTTGIGSSHRVRAIHVSGDALFAGDVSSFQSLASDREFTLQASGGGFQLKQADLQFVIATSSSDVALTINIGTLRATQDV